MSENISSLSKRKGLSNNLFERISNSKPQDRQALAREFLIGESTIHGALSFYDFIEGDNANKKVYICSGSSCLCAHTQDRVRQCLSSHFSDADIGQVACLGRCHENHSFQIDGINYSGKSIETLDSILSHATSAQSSNDHYGVHSSLTPPQLTHTPNDLDKFYSLLDNPHTKDPESLLKIIEESGLRGCGGAGFPTGFKWRACKSAVSTEKYLVCNADEGDPGAFIDRYLMEKQTHRLLFGMLVAAIVSGARVGIIYIRDEYPESIDQCNRAIEEIKTLGILDRLINGFRFRIIRGRGAYICGEETALLRSIEGQRPMVSARPPFPTEVGLFGQPTIVNNVETFAHVHSILSMGSKSFKAVGTGKSSGSKLLSIDSSVKRPGIYEVAMGTPLADVIYTMAGGFSNSIKALHIGGPLGGLVPVSKIDSLTVDFESFESQGFLLGHGSIIGIPEDLAIIEYLKHLFSFTADESCGKCFPCRLGSVRGKEMLQLAIDGKARINKSLLLDLLETLELGSLCALGSGLPLPIYNALEYFSDELAPFFNPEITS